MVHMQGVSRITRLVALATMTTVFGVAVTACNATGSAAPETVTVGSTVLAPPNTTSVTVPGSAGPIAPVSSAPVAVSGGDTQSSAPNSSGPSSSGPNSSGPNSSAPNSSAPNLAPASSAPVSSPVALPVATVSASPAFGSKTLDPADPFTISVGKGKITDLKVLTPSGRALKGDVSADGTTWTVGEVLGFGKTYTASGTATGTDGRTVPIKGSVTTVNPASKVQATISPGDGKVVGVATSLIVAFSTKPTDRDLIAKAMTITTTPKVTGAWVWIQHDDKRWALDFRTQSYWPAGTKVHVEAKIYGLKFATGAYGAGDVTRDFTIGRSQVVKANVNSHFLEVFQNGKKVASYPASYGKGDTPDKITRSGVHVVNDLFPTKLMSNPKYGYTNVLEKWAVRISDNGEFIHANPKTVGDQGNTNVSHGCVNLSAKDAEAYFKSVLMGDPVEVTGTSIQLGSSDGDLFDWTYSWDQWKNLSVKQY